MGRMHRGGLCCAGSSDARRFWGSSPSCRPVLWRWGLVPALTSGACELARLGHEARLIPPAYVKPFAKRQKSDAADAEAICEAARRPTMRFVAVKSEEQQAAAMIVRTCDLLVRQRTQLINALRRHLGEFGLIVPQGASQAGQLVAMVADPDAPAPGCGTTGAARPAVRS